MNKRKSRYKIDPEIIGLVVNQSELLITDYYSKNKPYRAEYRTIDGRYLEVAFAPQHGKLSCGIPMISAFKLMKERRHPALGWAVKVMVTAFLILQTSAMAQVFSSPGIDYCLLRPDSITSKPSALVYTRAVNWSAFPVPVDAVGFIAELLKNYSQYSEATEKTSINSELASLSVQYSFKNDPNLRYAPIGAWVNDPDAPKTTLSGLCWVFLWSGNTNQRQTAGYWLRRVIESPNNERCN